MVQGLVFAEAKTRSKPSMRVFALTPNAASEGNGEDGCKRAQIMRAQGVRASSKGLLHRASVPQHRAPNYAHRYNDHNHAPKIGHVRLRLLTATRSIHQSICELQQ